MSTAPPAAPPRRTRRRRRDWTGLVFVTPFLAVFTIGIVAPLVYASGLSLFRDQLIGGRSFVGLGNYADALTDARFLEGLSRVALFLGVQVPIMIGLALLAALILDSGRVRAMRFMRIGIFMPYAVPSVVAALMWGFMYGDQFGLVAQLNEATGLALPSPLSSTWVLAAIGNVVTWEFVGYNMLILYAALRAVPEELYEAAAIDGAGEVRVALSIKIPALRPALWVATLFSIIGSFQLFNEPNVLQSLAPAAISTYFTPNMYAYQLAFNANQVTYSAAVAVLLGGITVVVAYVAQRLTERGNRR
ncbi:carbohydrate ABC transporter permease [Nocardiopsis aegyptia]|uniref:Multiple sugar transport system permease protein n=1 Tax=Nocardiopsis aegyptia TaxID=220378 RepID=A0A7Z0ELB5_9ACTN|nr:sugar ABC transporter permease [Nocardiopsis aegyptia]NYJ33972.1 multiple sugar transport system permease protein [Nocardiopsis aegyptia]